MVIFDPKKFKKKVNKKIKEILDDLDNLEAKIEDVRDTMNTHVRVLQNMNDSTNNRVQSLEEAFQRLVDTTPEQLQQILESADGLEKKIELKMKTLDTADQKLRTIVDEHIDLKKRVSEVEAWTKDPPLSFTRYQE